MKKVFVGLSGGVDSSVATLLLKKAGYDVTGVFIKAWHPDFLPCNWRAEMHDAMRICARLNIPFLLCDLEKEYKEEIIDYLIAEYKNGNTPNPDVLCNKKIKFGNFLKFAEERGADFVATGHYALKEQEGSNLKLLIPKDLEKDQTYFLWTLNSATLSKILFPLGNLDKKEVRNLANQNLLHTANKKDSQGLCFIGHVDIKSFLKRYIETQKGEVLDLEGKVIGTHDGSELYTIGERRGFLLFNQINQSKPHYIVRKDLLKNTLTVSELDSITENLKIKKISLQEVNLINPHFNLSKKITIRTRYRGNFISAQLKKTSDSFELEIEEGTEDVAQGQSIVFYNGKECLGGGVVKKTF